LDTTVDGYAIADHHVVGNEGVVANVTVAADFRPWQHVGKCLDPRAIAHAFGLHHGRAVFEG
jgi:hypothetical protein